MNKFLNHLLHWNAVMNTVMKLFFTVIVYVLTFVVKYPKFNIHSALAKSCIDEERKKICGGSPYILYSLEAFSLLALVILSKREQLMELGLSSMLLGLTIDTSMEIPGTRGPNLWYMFGAVLFRILIIILRLYIETIRDIFVKLMSAKQRDIIGNCLEIFSAAVGMVFLCISPFSKKQFEDAADLKASCFIVFTLLLGYFMARAPQCVNYMADRCRDRLLVEAMETEKKLALANLFDLLSVAAFSCLALAISARREESTIELGIFHFLLELTMDASIETLDNKVPNLMYILGAAIYCLVLIFVRIHLEHSHSQRRNVSGSTSVIGLKEIRVEGGGHNSGDVAGGERSTETVGLLTEHKLKEGGLRRRKKKSQMSKREGLIEDHKREEVKLQGRNDGEFYIPIEGWFDVPEPPAFPIGLNAPLKKLKRKLLGDDYQLLSITGKGGIGTTTLAQMLCNHHQIKEKFKKNILFVKVPKRNPDLRLIVQRLYQQMGYSMPSFQDEGRPRIWLERLLREMGQTPLLLVLDDVWHPMIFVKNFIFEIPGYKILVTSPWTIQENGPEYKVKPLNDKDAITLFCHYASLKDESSNIPNDLIKEVVTRCSGNPLALKVMGSSLRGQAPEIWQRQLENWSTDSPGLTLPSSLNVLDDKDVTLKECFMDLVLFPEPRKIAATALIDMWAELYELDEVHVIANLFKLSNWNLVNVEVTRKNVNEEDDYYGEHFITQHEIIRDLAIKQIKQDKKKQRLIVDLSQTSDARRWREEIEEALNARLIVFSPAWFPSEWHDMELPEATEVLVLNFLTNYRDNHPLPGFIRTTSKLKVLIITNYGFFPAELRNFKLLGSLTNLKRIILEHIAIPSLSEILTILKQLQKLSLFMCTIGEAFSSVKISGVLSGLVEINIDCCKDVEELPVGLCEVISLKKLSITRCHKLSSLPNEIGKLVNLEVLRLRSSTGLESLPNSICKLSKLKFLDISDCIGIGNLPESFGELRSLTKLNIKNCSALQELPPSVSDFKQLDVVCDEDMKELWELHFPSNAKIKFKVGQK